jgi:hypothetical protein
VPGRMVAVAARVASYARRRGRTDDLRTLNAPRGSLEPAAPRVARHALLQLASDDGECVGVPIWPINFIAYYIGFSCFQKFYENQAMAIWNVLYF